ncbi:chitinase 1 [Fusarium heterosporum]|uniref:chitinase n=1 Tax=Fusarium heterosporum TaxID=42747 RepID=A0A8H5TWT6_FUSHE|nr:chitinase 1 [Fusarium heterosporum]
MKDWGFDGIDVDWEYPSNADDADNMVLLLQAVRDGLDEYAVEFASGHHFQLSIAAPAGLEQISFLRINALSTIIDHFNLMTYDYVSTGTASHNANLFSNKDISDATPFNTDDAVKAYLNAGAPRTKIVLGIPVYGRSFTGTLGLGHPSSSVGLTDPGLGSWENGVWDYKVLPKGGASVLYDAKAGAHFSYDTAAQELISYDTPETIQHKVSYVKDLGLAGSMFWETSGDKRTDAESLISTSARWLGDLDQTNNWLSYPNSKYQNIATGMREEI